MGLKGGADKWGYNWGFQPPPSTGGWTTARIQKDWTTCEQTGMTDACEHSTVIKKYTFCFQATQKHLPDHIWGQKTNLNKWERAEIIQSVCSLAMVESN